METNPFNPAARRWIGGIWNEDVLPVTDREATEHRIVLPANLQSALHLNISVLRWSATKRDEVLRARPQLRERVDRLGELLVDWVVAGLKPGDRGGWHVVFRDGHHINEMVFGEDGTGSWNVITMFPLRGTQITRLDAEETRQMTLAPQAAIGDLLTRRGLPYFPPQAPFHL